MFKELFMKMKLKKAKVFLEKEVVFKKAEFEGSNRIGKRTNIRKAKIGFGTYIGENCLLNNVKIGRFCSIGNNIRIVLGNHPLNYVSTHPFCYTTIFEKEGLYFKNIKKFDDILRLDEDKVLEIGSDVWIGDNVVIFGGVKIGDGAVLGTGTIITKDVPAYSVIVGIPGKVLKMRFSQNEIEFLEKLKWWNKDKEWLEKNIDKFSNISNLMFSEKN